MTKKIPIEKIFPRYGEQKCEFILGAHNSRQFPQTYYPEFAFIGASNVGKSSLINALTAQKVAIVSNTPGRTRQLNFFLLSERIMIVDMPGYGFAKASDKHMDNWQRTSSEYFTSREQLQRVFLLIDPVKGLKDTDRDIIEFFNNANVPFQIVLTKIDKLKKAELSQAIDKITQESQFWPALYPQLILASTKTGEGLDDIKYSIVEILAEL